MKSGPVLNGWTSRPRVTRAAIRPLAIVVLPQPLCVPAITIRGISACMMMVFAGFTGIIYHAGRDLSCVRNTKKRLCRNGSVEILNGICKNALLGSRQSLPKAPARLWHPPVAIVLYYLYSCLHPDTCNTKASRTPPLGGRAGVKGAHNF